MHKKKESRSLLKIIQFVQTSFFDFLHIYISLHDIVGWVMELSIHYLRIIRLPQIVQVQPLLNSACSWIICGKHNYSKLMTCLTPVLSSACSSSTDFFFCIKYLQLNFAYKCLPVVKNKNIFV